MVFMVKAPLLRLELCVLSYLVEPHLGNFSKTSISGLPPTMRETKGPIAAYIPHDRPGEVWLPESAANQLSVISH